MHEIGIFINLEAQVGLQKKALKLAEHADIPARFLTFPFKDTNRDINTFVIVGGDGSQKGVVEEVLKRDDTSNINILVVPGGSENGFARAAQMSGAVTTSEQILSGDYSKLRIFRPGEIDGELFNHAASFGKHAVNLEKMERKLRGKLPRSTRTFAAAMIEITRSIAQGETHGGLAKILVTGSNLGSLPLFPHHDVFSNDLGLVSLSGGTKREVSARVWTMLMCLRKGIPIPSSVAEWERTAGVELELSPEEMAMNVDGEIRYARSEKVIAARSTRSVNLAALKF